MASPAPASVADKRNKLVEAAMKKHQYRPDALIEILHAAQEVYGYLDKPLLLRIARSLKVPPSRVFGVATFYHLFSMAPKGEHKCVICLGTACYVKGAGDLLAAFERRFGIKAGETTPDGKVSLISARCLGACGLAPALVFDDAVAGKLTEEQSFERMKGWQSNGPG